MSVSANSFVLVALSTRSNRFQAMKACESPSALAAQATALTKKGIKNKIIRVGSTEWVWEVYGKDASTNEHTILVSIHKSRADAEKACKKGQTVRVYEDKTVNNPVKVNQPQVAMTPAERKAKAAEDFKAKYGYLPSEASKHVVPQGGAVLPANAPRPQPKSLITKELREGLGGLTGALYWAKTNPGTFMQAMKCDAPTCQRYIIEMEKEVTPEMLKAYAEADNKRGADEAAKLAAKPMSAKPAAPKKERKPKAKPEVLKLTPEMSTETTVNGKQLADEATQAMYESWLAEGGNQDIQVDAPAKDETPELEITLDTPRPSAKEAIKKIVGTVFH